MGESLSSLDAEIPDAQFRYFGMESRLGEQKREKCDFKYQIIWKMSTVRQA